MEVKEMMNAAYTGPYTTRNEKKRETEAVAADKLDVRSEGMAPSTAKLDTVAAARIDLSAAATAHGEAVKGLSTEQVDVLKSGIEKSMNLMIQTMTEANAKLQSWLDAGVGMLNFDGVQVEAFKFALPPVGTTPEEAAAAIAPGGEYSVEKVADRIFNLAVAIAGNDPERLRQMQAAIEAGFEQAGFAFGEAFDGAEMPQITRDTHDEISRRFDELYAKLSNNSAKMSSASFGGE